MTRFRIKLYFHAQIFSHTILKMNPILAYIYLVEISIFILRARKINQIKHEKFQIIQSFKQNENQNFIELSDYVHYI